MLKVISKVLPNLKWKLFSTTSSRCTVLLLSSAWLATVQFNYIIRTRSLKAHYCTVCHTFPRPTHPTHRLAFNERGKSWAAVFQLESKIVSGPGKCRQKPKSVETEERSRHHILWITISRKGFLVFRDITHCSSERVLQNACWTSHSCRM